MHLGGNIKTIWLPSELPTALCRHPPDATSSISISPPSSEGSTRSSAWPAAARASSPGGTSPSAEVAAPPASAAMDWKTLRNLCVEGWRRAGDGSEVKLGEGDGIFQGHNKPETKLGSAEEATDMTTGRGSAHPLADLSTKLRDGLLLLLHTPFNDTPLRPGASRRGRWGGQSLVLCRELTRRLSRPLRRGKLPLQILHLGLCHMPRCGTFIKESRKCPTQCIFTYPPRKESWKCNPAHLQGFKPAGSHGCLLPRSQPGILLLLKHPLGLTAGRIGRLQLHLQGPLLRCR